jgi:hypothetical protein
MKVNSKSQHGCLGSRVFVEWTCMWKKHLNVRTYKYEGEH